MVVFFVSHRAFRELDIGDSLRVALGPALLSTSPVDSLVVAFVADVREAVDDKLWVAALSRNEGEFHLRLALQLRLASFARFHKTDLVICNCNTKVC